MEIHFREMPENRRVMHVYSDGALVGTVNKDKTTLMFSNQDGFFTDSVSIKLPELAEKIRNFIREQAQT